MTPTERLGFLQAKLRQPLPQDVRFDMSVWRVPRHDCRTAACAFGYATMIPELQAEGLMWSDVDKVIKYLNWRSMVAAKYFFGLTTDQADFLFDHTTYRRHFEDITPAMVADRIDEVIRELDAAETG